MDYQKIYNNICEKGKTERQLDSYCEKHHIIPKCLGGDDSKENITKLTYREHFIVHLLLTKIHKKHRGINYALLCMLRKQPTGERLLNSRMFESIKRNFSKYKKLYCTIENPGKSEKSREKARQRMLKNNPIKNDPSKNRTAQPIRIYFGDGKVEEFKYAKEFCIKYEVPYATMKVWLRKNNSSSKKHKIIKIERI